ncbi:MAG: Ig-like domain-containing protein [Clostridia bacterium]|nr:Ig-like domain-containing protein [Clostridia bacterium]
MTKMKRMISVLLILALAATLFAGCRDTGDNPSDIPGEAALNMSEAVISLYETVFITLENPPEGVIDWHMASGESNVRMEQTGNTTVQITGLYEGTSMLHCEFDRDGQTVMLTCNITVVPNSFTINPSSFVLQYGHSLNLGTFPNFASELVWESSDDNVVIVDAKGKVTAVGVGIATVTAKVAKKPDISAKAAVTVTEASNIITGNVSIVPSVLETEVGGTVPLSVSGGTGTYTWKSSDPAKASVTANGIVTALSTGTVTITATDSVGGSATCKITIYRAPTAISVSPVSALMNVGDSKKFTASVYPADASKNINWYSSDTSIAKVSSSGVVTVLKSGTVTITAQSAYNSVKATATVSTGTKATGITVDKATVDQSVGSIFTVNATVAPANAAIKTYTVAISDTNIVKQNGNTPNSFVAVAPGTATITFKSDDGGFTAKTTVTVRSTVKKATIDPTVTEVGIGAKSQLSVQVDPADAKADGEWKIADTSIATVDEKGVVTGVKEGVTSVSYIFKDTNLTITAVIRVLKSGALNKEKLDLVPGGTAALTVSQADLVGTWSSDQPDIVTVDDKGVVTALKEGKANILFTPEDKSFRVLGCAVTVYAATESVELDAKDVYLVKDGLHLPKLTIKPEGAKQTGEWKLIEGEDVVTLGADGALKALKDGKALVEVTTIDGMKLEMHVYVGKRVAGVAFEKKTYTVASGGQFTPKLIFDPAAAANTSGTWQSENPQVASVSQKGVITGNVAGETKITFTSTDGGFKAECTVTVTQPNDRKIGLSYGKLSITPNMEILVATGTIEMTATLTPTADKITYSASLAEPVEGFSVKADGDKITLTAEKSGKAKVIVMAKVGDATYAITFTVSAAAPTPTPTPTAGATPTATPTPAPTPTPAA